MHRPTLAFTLTAAIALLPALGAEARAQQAPPSTPPQTAPASPAPAKDQVPGVRNFTRVDATIACGGALSGTAAADLQQAGFKSVVNLRAAGEEGANLEAEKKAVEEAELTYIWLPFVTKSPDATKVDEFLKAVVEPANQPMLLHCASGGRASMFWAIKRVMVDGWPVDKAMSELPDLSKNVSAPLKNFALDYLKQHGK